MKMCGVIILGSLLVAVGGGGTASAGICCHLETRIDGAYASESGDSYLLVRRVGENLQVRGFDPRSSWSGVCVGGSSSKWTCHAEVHADDGAVRAVTSTLLFDPEQDRLTETWAVTSDSEGPSATTNWNRLVPRER